MSTVDEAFAMGAEITPPSPVDLVFATDQRQRADLAEYDRQFAQGPPRIPEKAALPKGPTPEEIEKAYIDSRTRGLYWELIAIDREIEALPMTDPEIDPYLAQRMWDQGKADPKLYQKLDDLRREQRRISIHLVHGKWVDDPWRSAMDEAKGETREEYWIKRVPFGGSVYELIGLVRVHNSLKKYEKSEATYYDMRRIADFVKQAQDRNARSWMRYTLDIASQIPGFAVEFGLTSGVYSGVRVGATKGLGKLGVSRVTAGIASRLAGVAAQTAANPAMIARSVAQRAMPKFSLDDGELKVDLKNTPGFWEAMGRGVGDAYIEMLTERAGYHLMRGTKGAGAWVSAKTGLKVPKSEVAAKLKQAVAARWMRVTGKGQGEFGEKLLEKGGWHGIFEESMEERAGELMRAGIGNEQLPDYLSADFAKHLAAEITAFGMVGGSAKTAGYVADRLLPEEGQKTSAPQVATPVDAARFAEAEPEKAAAYAEKEEPTRPDWRKAGLPRQKTTKRYRAQVGKWIESALDARHRRQRSAEEATPEAEKPEALGGLPEAADAGQTESTGLAEEAAEAKPWALGPEWREWPAGEKVPGWADVQFADGRWNARIPRPMAKPGLPAPGAAEKESLAEAEFSRIIADVANQMEIDAGVLRGEVEYEHGQRLPAATEREDAKGYARQVTGLNSADIKRIDNAGFDYSTDSRSVDLSRVAPKQRGLVKAALNKLKRFDKWAIEVARQYPGLIGHAEEDSAKLQDNLWGLIREGKQSPPGIRDWNLVREVADRIRGAQTGGQAYEEEEGEFDWETGEFVDFQRKIFGADDARQKEFSSFETEGAPAAPKPTQPLAGQRGLFEGIEEAQEPQKKPKKGGPAEDQRTLFQERAPNAEPGVGEYGRKPGPAVGAMGKDARWQMQPVPLPELIEITKELLGSVPRVKNLRRALGYFVGPEGGAAGRMVLDAIAAGDATMVAKVLAHEIGHMVDWLDQRTLARGNILGRIASLRGYMKGWLEREPGGPAILAKEDRKRLRKEAKRLAAIVDETVIDEVIEEQLGIKAEDVLAIWNSVDQDELNPGLLEYVKGLSMAEKLSIVKEALRGVVPEELRQFGEAKRRKTGRTKTIRIETSASAQEVDALWKKMIAEEIAKRELLSRETIREELVALSEWWTPYDKSKASPRYIKYRESSRELYAEALSVFLNSPGELAVRAPEFYRGFSRWLDQKPEVLRKFIQIQQLLNGVPEELAARRTEGVFAMFATGDEMRRALHAESQAARKGGLVAMLRRLEQAILTSWGPVKREIKRLKKRGLDTQQARAAWYAMSELAYADNPNHRMLTLIQRHVGEPLAEAGIDRQHLGAYLFFVRTQGDRSDKANPRGLGGESSEQGLRDLRRRLGDEKYALLRKTAKRFHEIVFQSTERAIDAGVYPAARARELFANKYTYATFSVLDHMTDKIPAGLYRQVGTYKDVENLYDVTLLKMISLNRLIEVNSAKGKLRDFMRRHMEADIQKKVVPYKSNRPADRPRNEYDYLVMLEDGQKVAYEMPIEMVRSFEREDVGELSWWANILNSATYRIFHPVFVTFSPGFLAANPFRDLRRTWINLGTLGGKWRAKLKKELLRRGHNEGEADELARKQRITLGQVLWAFLKALPAAHRRARGIEDSTIDEMFRQKALSIPFIELEGHLEGGGEGRRLMQKYRVVPLDKERGKIMSLLKWFGDKFEYAGMVQETATKVAAWDLITDRMKNARKLGVQQIEASERSYATREYAGTPNFKQKGLVTPVTNSLMMYSNVRWQGLAADMELAADKSTAAGWWWRQFVSNVVPTSLNRLAAYGAFGTLTAMLLGQPPDDDDDEPGVYGRIGSYFLTDYDSIPLGLVRDANGSDTGAKALFLSIPKDDTGKIISRVWANGMDIAYEAAGGQSRRGSVGRAIADSFGTTKDAIVPSISPPLDIGYSWAAYLAGENPRDRHYDSNIIPAAEFQAGGWHGAKKMLAWTQMKFGVAGEVAEFVTGPVLGKPFESAEPSTIERLLRLPTGAQRLLRLSDRGISEEHYLTIELEQQGRAAERLKLPVAAIALRKEYNRYRTRKGSSLTPSERKLKARSAQWNTYAYAKIMKAIYAADSEARRVELRKQLGESARRVLAADQTKD